MTARIAILAAVIWSTSQAQPQDVAVLAVAIAHVEQLPVDAADVIATAWVETGKTMRRDLVSRVGACGSQQVIPKWSAPFGKHHGKLTCEQMQGPIGGVQAGVVVFHYWTLRARRHSAAEHYVSGNNPGFAAGLYGRAHARQRKIVASKLEAMR